MKKTQKDRHRHTDTYGTIPPSQEENCENKEDSGSVWYVCKCAFECACVGGMQSLYHYTHYTSCFQQFHLINNKCPVITATPPALLPVFCQLPPGQPPVDPMAPSILTCCLLQG